MNRKVLYVIIAVLALILIAGLVFVFGMQANAPQADAAQTDAPQNETGGSAATGDGTNVDAPAVDSADPGTEDVPAEDAVTEDAPAQTEESVQQTEAVEPTEEMVPEDTRLIPDVPEIEAPAEEEMTYEKYHAMSGDEQAAFINSFDSYEAFFQWYNAAEEKYKEDMIPIDGSTPIDLGNP